MITDSCLLKPEAFSRYGLSHRQGQILSLLCAGKENKEIAADLGIGVKTVEYHLQEATYALGFIRRRRLITKLYRERLVILPGEENAAGQ